MEIVVKRTVKTEKSTISTFCVVGTSFNHYCLEDKDRGLLKSMQLDEIRKIKVPGKTAIPAGRYQVILSMSTRFKKVMPEILGVPGFAGIRIHNGNTPEHTDGCLLVGLSKYPDFVGSSIQAYTEFFPILKKAIDKGEKVFITIS